MTWIEVVAQADQALRSGQIAEATAILKSVSFHEVPRESRLKIANLCRRSGLWVEGLKLLAPHVRPKQGGHPDASDAEKAEYANLLMKVGSAKEAKGVLLKLQRSAVPELDMFLAFCEIALWNYESAITLLKKYLESQPEHYQALIAQVNLASALIWTERSKEANSVLAVLVEEAERTRSLRLLANTLELRSQVHLQLGEIGECEENLQKARNLLNSNSTSDQLFIQKWQSICSAHKSNSTEPLQEFRKTALARHHWETVRECDFHTLKLAFDDELFQQLICGTPHASYRTKVCRALSRPLPEGLFQWGSKDGPCLDVRTGELSTGEPLNGGKKIHQLISILLNDFYKPVSIGEIFSEICPDEHYDIFTSPARVHQVITRSRKFFEKNQIPATVALVEPGFAIERSGPFSFLIPFERNSVAGPLAQIEKLKHLGQSEFSVDEVSQLLRISKPSARRLLRWGVDHSRFIRIGAGPSTLYKMTG